MARQSYDNRTLAPGIPTDAWESDGDKGSGLGSNPSLSVNVSNKEPVPASIEDISGVIVALNVLMTDLRITNKRTLEEIMLLNKRFEETFNTGLNEIDND